MLKKPKKSVIPIEFLLLMGTCDVTIHGVKVTAHVANCAAAIDKRIAELRSYLECNTKVVGLDVKNIKHGHYSTKAIVLCVFRRCLIIHLHDNLANGYDQAIVESLDNFFKDHKICFVGVTELPNYSYNCPVKLSNSKVGVKVGDLAARVLNKPLLIESSLVELANQVGVSYDGPTSASAEIEIDSRNSMVFTDEHVVDAASNAYAYYQIGYKLLTSL